MSRKAVVRERSHVPPPSLDEGVNHSVFVSPADAVQVETFQPGMIVDDGPEVHTSTIEVPMTIPTVMDGYQPQRNRCDVQKISPEQWANARKIVAGLVARGAQLKNGKFVKCEQDAIKWMLENV